MTIAARPIYESDADRANERRVAGLVAPVLKADQFFKLSMAYGIDWAFVRNGNIFAFAECKCRSFTFGVSDGYRIALLKCIKARQIVEETGLRCYLFVEFRDGIIRGCSFSDVGNRCIWAGRTDRGDPNDMEPHMIIDWNKFRKLR